MTLGADRSPVANGRADLQHVTGAQRFAIGETDLLFDGEPFRVLAGALHYFRAHPGQWAGTCVLGCPGGGRGGKGALATLEAFKVRAAARTPAPTRAGRMVVMRGSRWLTGPMPLASDARVAVCGPASWNHLILLDRLPEPVPHMQFALGDLRTLGGTSAGKGLHLADLGVDVTLHALLGADDDGRRVSAALAAAGVRVEAYPSERTERHANLMTAAGERVSLYLATPSAASVGTLDRVEGALADADIAVVDLSEVGVAIVRRRLTGAAGAPIWTDLHDYDGSAEFHEPFLRAADVVFMNDDATDDPWSLMQSCLDRGPRLAVCTLGARGAVALAASGERATVEAVPVDVVDTNGSGDAFFAGFLAASLSGEDVNGCVAAGARQAVVALSSEHLHPAVAAGGVTSGLR